MHIIRKKFYPEWSNRIIITEIIVTKKYESMYALAQTNSSIILLAVEIIRYIMFIPFVF